MTAAVVHACPGRVRVKVDIPSERRRADALGALESLQEKHGVTQVSTNPRTGSALLQFDNDEISIDDAVQLVRTAHQAFDALAPRSESVVIDRGASAVAHDVQRKFSDANLSVLKATGGHVDLRALVPIGLAVMSGRQLLRQGIRFKRVPWYVLAYYSFDTFLKLHGGDASSAAKSGA